MAEVSPDGVYQAVFGGGALIGQGALVLRHGKAGGIGHDHGEYSGAYHHDSSSGVLELDIDVRVPSATPIAAGLKAGPAGSTVRATAKGMLATPSTTLPVDLAGHKCELVLRRVGVLHVSPNPRQSSTDHGVPHADAFPNGIYRIESAGIGYLTHTVIVLADGHLVGVGEMGGNYFGTYAFDTIRKLTAFTGYAELPPNIPLVTGGSTGPLGLKAPISSETKFNGGRSRFSFSMNGRAVDAALVYRRPLPG